MGSDSITKMTKPQSIVKAEPQTIEKTVPPLDLTTDRAKMLKTRYGHVVPSAAVTSPEKYHLHIRVDERAVNQGLCFYNVEQDVYYIRPRRACPFGQIPKEVIAVDLECPAKPSGHTHVEFSVIGKFWGLYMP